MLLKVVEVHHSPIIFTQENSSSIIHIHTPPPPKLGFITLTIKMHEYFLMQIKLIPDWLVAAWTHPLTWVCLSSGCRKVIGERWKYKKSHDNSLDSPAAGVDVGWEEVGGGAGLGMGEPLGTLTVDMVTLEGALLGAVEEVRYFKYRG